MYFLEHKENYTMPNILGNHSMPVKTWRWKQVAVCESRKPLADIIPRGKEKEYRIISNSTDYVEFIIDDREYFRKDLKRQNPKLSEQQIEEILNNLPKPFKAKFMISENGKNTLLTDDKNKLIPRTALNGYQIGIVLRECERYANYLFNNDWETPSPEDFTTTESTNNMPCGVVKIIFHRN